MTNQKHPVSGELLAAEIDNLKQALAIVEGAASNVRRLYERANTVQARDACCGAIIKWHQVARAIEAGTRRLEGHMHAARNAMTVDG